MVGALGFYPGLLPFRTSEELMAKFVTLLCISLFFLKNGWIKALMAWLIIRAFIGINAQSVIVLQTAFNYFLLFQVLVDNLNKDRIPVMLNIICIVGIVQSVMMILQYFGVWWVIKPLLLKPGCSVNFFEKTQYTLYLVQNAQEFRNGITGFTSNANMAGAVLGMCFPAFLRKKWCWYVLLIVPCLLISRTWGGIAPVFLVTVLFFLRRRARWQRILIMVLSGAIVFYAMYYLYWIKEDYNYRLLFTQAGSLGTRFNVARTCITKLIPFKPWIGWGVGQAQYLWKIIMKESGIIDTAWLHSHNEYIHIWIETGVIGFVLAMGYLVSALIKFVRKIDSIKFLVLLGLIAGLLNCIVNFTFHVTIGIVLIAYLSMMEYFNKTEVVE